MPNFNKVFLMGHLTENADLRAGQGKPYMLCTLAVNESWTTKEGKEHKRVDFIDCFMSGDRATNLAPHLVKGKPMMFEGKLRKDSYERDGRTHYVTRVEIMTVEFLSSKKSQDSSSPAPAQNRAPAQTANRQQEAMGLADDDIPF
jgi:single stranded DNA-binding protein